MLAIRLGTYFTLILYLPLLCLCKYTHLYELEGWQECTLIQNRVEDDYSVYDCGGKNVTYQDYQNQTDDDYYYAYPENVFYNSSDAAFYAVDEFPLGSNSTNQLSKRANVFVRSKQVWVGTCSALAASFITWSALHMAKKFKELSTACQIEENLVRHNGNGHVVHMSVTQNAASGENCDTTAQWKTIAGAMEKWYKEHEHLCGEWCLKMTHGGNWEGYASLGVGDNFMWASECESYGYYGGVSGGKNDYTGK